jgi:hypothetical protein
MGNLQDGEIDWEDLVYTSDNTEIQKYASPLVIPSIFFLILIN